MLFGAVLFAVLVPRHAAPGPAGDEDDEDNPEPDEGRR